MRTLRVALYSIILAAGCSSAVLAQSGGSGAHNFGYGSGGMRNACTDDYAKFCGNVSKYGMRQCQLDHQPDFSAACKTQRKAEAEAHKTGY